MRAALSKRLVDELELVVAEGGGIASATAAAGWLGANRADVVQGAIAHCAGRVTDEAVLVLLAQLVRSVDDAALLLSTAS